MKYIISLIIALSLYGTVTAQNDEYSQAFKKLVELSGTTSKLESCVRQMLSMKNASDRVPAEMNAKATEVVVAWMNEEVMPELEVAYRKHFTVDDLNQIIAFYESEIGKKYVEKGSQLAADLMALMLDEKKQASLSKRISEAYGVSQESKLSN